MNNPSSLLREQLPPLFGHRFLTFNTIVRCHQVEFTRTKFWGDDESAHHTPELAEKFRNVMARSWPGARMSWTMSWCALIDQRPQYRELRCLIVAFHQKYGDDIIFVPGGFHAIRYNSRDQINRDLNEGSAMIAEMVGSGYRPRAAVALYLPAACLRYLSEKERIHVCQGNCFSSYAIDMSDQEGSVAYPYYPSTEHSCKPAQGPNDFIDCANLDGWTCDFLAARRPGFEGGFNSRLGVGPIETIMSSHGHEAGLRQMLFTTGVHFDRGFELNRFGWVVVQWELSHTGARGKEAPKDLDSLSRWLEQIQQRWPGAQLPTMAEFGLIWRATYPDNSFDYRFEQRGSGIGGSDANLEIRWWMNKRFRLALMRDWQSAGPEKVIDFTRYDLPATEPLDAGEQEAPRDWSLMNRINQKATRPQDAPISLSELSKEEKALIGSCYPQLLP